MVHPVRVSDRDPGGIVFFPRFLEMVNDLIEDWFPTGIDCTSGGGLDLWTFKSMPIPTDLRSSAERSQADWSFRCPRRRAPLYATLGLRSAML